jgi:hypothetical protein
MAASPTKVPSPLRPRFDDLSKGARRPRRLVCLAWVTYDEVAVSMGATERARIRLRNMECALLDLAHVARTILTKEDLQGRPRTIRAAGDPTDRQRQARRSSRLVHLPDGPIRRNLPHRPANGREVARWLRRRAHDVVSLLRAPRVLAWYLAHIGSYAAYGAAGGGGPRGPSGPASRASHALWRPDRPIGRILRRRCSQGNPFRDVSLTRPFRGIGFLHEIAQGRARNAIEQVVLQHVSSASPPMRIAPYGAQTHPWFARGCAVRSAKGRREA